MIHLATGAMLPVLVEFRPAATGPFEAVLGVAAGSETFDLTIKGRGVAALETGESWNPPDGCDVAAVRRSCDPKHKAYTFDFGQVPAGQVAKACIAVVNRTGQTVELDPGALAAPFVSRMPAAGAPVG